MKNAMFSLLFLLAVMTASAQPKALGVRMGTEIQLSNEHGVGTRGDFLEVDMGYELIRLVNLAAAYDFMVARPEWTSKGEWGIYAGPAAKIGGAGVGYYLALGAQAGIEYTFDFPLQISLDTRPALGVAVINRHASLYGGESTLGGFPCLSVRYRFGGR